MHYTGAMSAAASDGLQSYLGKSPDDLNLVDRRRLAGKWFAMQRYTPENLALRRIEALGASPAECIRQLRSAGKELERFEFIQLPASV